ncbi:MAG: sulfatase/phosphatase domain-containing protein, partial [Limisphaerales bacterium]
ANSIRQEIGTCYDIFPTIADFVGAPIPKNHPVDGQDLAQLLSGKSNPLHRNEFLNHYPHPRRGQSHFFTTWRQGDWKVIYEYLNDGTDRYSLYNLAIDPSESNNLSSTHPKKLRTMLQGMIIELESRDAVYPIKDGQSLEPIIPSETP